jgi:hypothetical protein
MCLRASVSSGTTKTLRGNIKRRVATLDKVTALHKGFV